MSSNRISQSFWLFFFALCLFFLISWLTPQVYFEQYGIKKIDYLKPILTTPSQKKETVWLTNKNGEKIKQEVSSTDTIVKRIKRDIVTLEDYSNEGLMLKALCHNLKNCKDSSATCRIAYYGDSFIEGDIMTGALRNQLQTNFGGNGMGFIPINSESAYCRRLLPTSCENWNEYSISKQSRSSNLGIAGSCFMANSTSTNFTLKPSRGVNGLYLFYKAPSKTAVKHTYNFKTTRTDSLPIANQVNRIPLNNSGTTPIKRYELTVLDTNKAIFYGISHENGSGVYVDNFSIRGNSGLGINQINNKTFVDFQRFMNYKLIVLQYGINVSAPETTNFSHYESGMIKLVNRLKTIFPNAAILLISVGDRCHKVDDEMVTMPSIPLLVESQRRVAQKTGTLFWNLWEAMGWEGGMKKLVDAGMANKDYTHISYGAGNILANELYKALIHAYNSNLELAK